MTIDEAREAIKEAYGNSEYTDEIIKALEQIELNPSYNGVKFELEDWYDVPSDEMTLEQARQAVKDLRKKLAEYLEQQPCEECISREAVNVLIDELARAISDERGFMSRGRATSTIMEDILELPSVTPSRPRGKWIPYYDRWGDAITTISHFKCSVCGEYDYDKDKFCPYCGADMRGEEE